MAVKEKSRIGRVVSDKMEKTVVVAVEAPKRHPIYKKTVKRVTRYKVHDENNEARLADLVRITETRPISKEKRWRVAEILTKGRVVDVSPEQIETPPIEPIAEPVAELATEPVAEPTTEPVTEPTTEPVTEPVAEPKTEQADDTERNKA